VFNVGGGEFLVIALLALIVLGPQRLPDAARQIGRFMGELRRMSSGFQQELKAAMDDPLEAAARERGKAFKPKAADGPAVAPVPDSTPAPAPTTRPARTSAPRRRTTPLRAVSNPDDDAAPLRAVSSPDDAATP
jgi:sec-independent protein translocase protein TatB